MNDQIKMPGAGYHCASDSISQPMHLSPDFTRDDRGVDWFFANLVAPAVSEGVTDHLFHSAFGKEVEYGGLSDSGDMRWGMYEVASMSNDPFKRKHAYAMRDHLKSLATMKNLNIQMYCGTLRCPSMHRLISQGHVLKWWRSVFYSVAPFINEKNIGFVIDAIGSKLTLEDSPHWYAYLRLQKELGKGRVAMESFPRPEDEYKHLWNQRSLALEHHAQSYMSRHGTGVIGKGSMRFLDGKKNLIQMPGEHAPDWPLETGGFAAFVYDCHLNGQACYIAARLVKWQGTTFTEIRQQAQQMLDQRGNI